MQTTVTIHYLEMRRPDEAVAPPPGAAALDVRRSEVLCPEWNRFFYTAVGGRWYWIDRLGWTYERWLEYLRRPGQETWGAFVAGTPAGYFELLPQPGTGVEIAYFGLLPPFIGRGLGRQLLAAAVRRAWELCPPRLWLHTCSLDHPRALANYQAAGFRIYRVEQKLQELPDRPPGPWPGSDLPS